MTGPNEQAPQQDPEGDEALFEGTAPPPRTGGVRRMASAEEGDTGLEPSSETGDDGSIPRDTDEQR